MPRNQSEKLPSCPEAHAYADAIEKMFERGGDIDSNDAQIKRRGLYDAIPRRERLKITDARRATSITYVAVNLLFNIRYIRKNYEK